MIDRLIDMLRASSAMTIEDYTNTQTMRFRLAFRERLEVYMTDMSSLDGVHISVPNIMSAANTIAAQADINMSEISEGTLAMIVDLYAKTIATSFLASYAAFGYDDTIEKFKTDVVLECLV